MVRELADACGLSTPAVARLLAALVNNGLVAGATGRPPRFTAVVPDVAVTALIRRGWL
ncbi:winged helix-turn-helix domain-containing protein [Streptomyces sp. NPDC007095]|uniref:helix-turn-helix domain-containing protein n=1 Tax=Streptomyces sp. NPDC007095 TaxID=3154482 RepID=UPI000C70D9B6